jgi:hypothetical protein
MRTDKSGWLLLEVLTVCFLIGFCVSLFLVQQFNRSPFASTSLQIHALFSLCANLQKRALITGQEQRLIINPQKGAYFVDTQQEHILAPPINFDILPEVKGPPGAPKEYLTHPVTFAQNTIVFYPSGILSSGTLYLLDTERKILYAITNSVSYYSYLRLYRYDGKWEILC